MEPTCIPSSGLNPPFKRAKQACEECRARKRKCDGKLPACELCSTRGISCNYATEMRKRGRRLQTVPAARGQSEEYTPGSSVSMRRDTVVDQLDGNHRRMEANSGLAFPQLLSRRMDNADSAYRTRFLSWNLGCLPRMNTRNVSDVIPKDIILQYTAIYEEKIHPICSILDLNEIRSKITEKWDPEIPKICDDYDAIICCIGALGSLFSGGGIYEADLFDCARHQLDDNMLANLPTYTHVDARILRGLYLRSAAGPQASWLESSMLMLLFESLGAHQEYMSSILQPGTPRSEDIDLNRKRYWIARLSNSWISFEYGRPSMPRKTSSSDFAPATILSLPSNSELKARAVKDPTWEFLHLYRISEQLDPREEDDNVNLEQLMRDIVNFESHHDVVELFQSNIALAVFRRIRYLQMHTSTEIENLVIAAGSRGLQAAVRLTNAGEPWSQVANVPFQFFCILLIIDSQESLFHVREAISTIDHVAKKFNTPSVVEVHNTAAFLLKLFQKKMQSDMDSLKNILSNQIPVPEPLASTHPTTAAYFHDFGGPTSGYPQVSMPVTTAPMSNIPPNDLNWHDIDWNIFLGSAQNYHI